MNGNEGLINIANNQSLNFTKNPQQNNVYQKQQQQGCQEKELQINEEEEKAIIMYYLYEDFQNFLNLLYSYQVVCQHFKPDRKNLMIQICENKIKAQMNISNAIHLDLQKNYEKTKLNEFLRKNKSELKKKIQINWPQDIKQYIQDYEKICLNDNVIISQIQLNPVQLKANFNEKVLQQLIPQMQAVDNKVKEIRQAKNYPIPSIQNMQQTAQKYQNETKLKLKNQK